MQLVAERAVCHTLGFPGALCTDGSTVGCVWIFYEELLLTLFLENF